MARILFRDDRESQDELAICKKHFRTTRQRTDLIEELVIGRYSVLPFYQELEADLKNQGSKLINSYSQHAYIADFQYYFDIEDWTPKTYFDTWDRLPEGKFVVKGKTNSRKFEWNTKMFAPTKKDAVRIALDLMNDLMIGPQGIIIRQYEELKNVGYSINGMPFANEHRCFFLGETLLSHGFYWSISEEIGQINEKGISFVKAIAKIIAPNVNFFVIDIAEKPDGEWTVIEINDGQMSGLSLNDPETLYSNLKSALEKQDATKNI